MTTSVVSKSVKRGRKALSHIKGLAQSIGESEENANDVVVLLQYLEADEQPVLRLAIQTLSEVFTHLVKENYNWLVPSGASQGVHQAPPTLATGASGDVDDDLTQSYREWMRRNYGACIDRLLQLLRHRDLETQEISLDALMNLVSAEVSAHQTLHHAYHYPNGLFCRITSAILDSSDDMTGLVDYCMEYMRFDDTRFYWLKNTTSIIRSKLDQRKRLRGQHKHPQPSTQFVQNIHHALRGIVMPKAEEDLTSFLVGDLPGHHGEGGEGEKVEGGEGEEVEGREEEKEEGEAVSARRGKKRRRSRGMALNIRSLTGHRKQFSNAWLAFLRLPLPSATFKEVLVNLHSAVMPHLLDPRQLIDFLVDTYNTGGVVSILALNGLFILIHEHHLNYPDFFLKLYALLEPLIFHVKYMQRFFHLMDTFLRSSHLPLYLVAAFAKKIARLSLSAPPNGVMVAVVFVTNLIKRHRNCRVLLHRKDTEGIEMSSDPFDMEEPDPAKCKALESCLWELKSHESHYLPVVSTLVKRLLHPNVSGITVEHRKEEDLGKFLNIVPAAMFEEECGGSLGTDDVPLTFVEPQGLWKS